MGNQGTRKNAEEDVGEAELKVQAERESCSFESLLRI
jgi:hypothetical protein